MIGTATISLNSDRKRKNPAGKAAAIETDGDDDDEAAAAAMETPTKKRKSSPEESQDDRVGSPRSTKKTRTKLPPDWMSNSVHPFEDLASLDFTTCALDLEPSMSTSSSTSKEDGIWDWQDDCLSIYTRLLSLGDNDHLDSEDRCFPCPTLLESTAADDSGYFEPLGPR